MHAEEPKSAIGSVRQSMSTEGAADPAPSNSAAERRGSGRLLWLMTAIAGLLAGVVAALIGEADNDAIPLYVTFPSGYEAMGGYQKDAVRAEAIGKASQIKEKRKAALVYGTLGILLGISLGLTGGLAAGSARSALKAATLGAITGAVLPAALSYALVPLFYRYMDPESGGLLVLFLTHAGIFAVVGIAAGLALGSGLGRRRAVVQAALGGLLGALVGTIAFETVNSLAFPLVRTFEPMSDERVPRLLVHVCVAFGAALCAGLAVRTRNSQSSVSLTEQGKPL